MNTTRLFNDGWEFAKSDLETTDWRGLDFSPVDLPHDWLIYDTLNLYENSIGWYRRIYEHTGSHRVFLNFDGVYMDSTLYVNGKAVGEWKYGYTAFEHELTEALQEGPNEIVMKVVHQSPNSRWYSGAGIYRNVWLKLRGPNFIHTDGTYVTARLIGGKWAVEVDTEVSHTGPVEVRHIITDSEGNAVAQGTQVLSGSGFNVDQQVLPVESPRLWSPDEPVLYTLTTELYVLEQDTRVKVESFTQNIGFRTIVMDPQDGLFVNGKPVKLNGVCEHHDLGALGAAFNKAALRRRFKILKEMGVNAIRTAHNPPAKEFMDLADEMGFLVVSEAFDMWELPKTKYDYARFFNDWAEKDVRSWVRRDRNHPCLLMWSIGNEIYDTHAGPRGQEITRMLRDFVRDHDPRGNAPVTIGSNYMPWEGAQKCADILKIAGYNYGEKYYHEHRKKFPDWIMYGSETGSVTQSRGIYHFPHEREILSDDDEQCSALGNSNTSWGAKSPEEAIINHRPDFILGQFIWTGFDYIGEPTPYHTKNSYFGQIDTATFPKDPYYIYQSAWTNYKENPMVHIFPYWDFNPGQIIDVRVCSNAPLVELRLNGRLIGTHHFDHVAGENIVPTWKVPYEPGILEAVAYDEDGRVIVSCVRRTFGDTARLVLNPDKRTLTADGQDLVFVEVSAVDQEGNPVENASNRVSVTVTGAGRLIGLDNGDSTDYDQYKGLSRRLFSGKLMAIIAAKLEPGPISVRVSSPGLEPQVLELEAVSAAEPVQGLTVLTENTDTPIINGTCDELPVRKIELHCQGNRTLTEENPEAIVTAHIYPQGASYQEVEWSVVADGGIPSNLAKIEADGHTAKVRALGDGEFRVRCVTRNGTEKIKLISELEFMVEGMGVAYKDPYSFVSAGLYDYSRGDIGPGNERGVSTARDGESHVGFRNIDFGPYGSDTITIPIFALNDDAYRIQIWEGIPGEAGSELVGDVIYQKPSIWNVYQAETYKLNRRLKGVTTLCFVLDKKVHIKGFSFERQSRAFAKNQAVDCDKIYGDSYTMQEAAVEGIGNNVSLIFDDMDFGEEGAVRLVICGRASVHNTIHVQFSGRYGESRQIIEFAQSDDYVEREFVLEPIKGTHTVSFIFLPGSNFDFAWFQFQGGNLS